MIHKKMQAVRDSGELTMITYSKNKNKISWQVASKIAESDSGKCCLNLATKQLCVLIYMPLNHSPKRQPQWVSCLIAAPKQSKQPRCPYTQNPQRTKHKWNQIYHRTHNIMISAHNIRIEEGTGRWEV